MFPWRLMGLKLDFSKVKDEYFPPFHLGCGGYVYEAHCDRYDKSNLIPSEIYKNTEESVAELRDASGEDLCQMCGTVWDCHPRESCPD